MVDCLKKYIQINFYFVFFIGGGGSFQKEQFFFKVFGAGTKQATRPPVCLDGQLSFETIRKITILGHYRQFLMGTTVQEDRQF